MVAPSASSNAARRASAPKRLLYLRAVDLGDVQSVGATTPLDLEGIAVADRDDAGFHRDLLCVGGPHGDE